MKLEKGGALFFGFETVDEQGKIHRQFVIRGNGDLVLNSESLIFSQWVLKRKFVIPIREIQSVKLARSHNGKWVLFNIVLKIRFTDTDGQVKIAGFTVGWKKAALQWKQEIERAAGI